MNLANWWVENGHVVDFVVMNPDGGFRSDLSPTVRIIELSPVRGALPARIKLIRAFARYLSDEEPDRVFATLTYATITALWAGVFSGFRGKLVARQANSLNNQQGQSFPVKIWNELGYRFCYLKASGIIVNSKNSADELAQAYPRLSSKIRLIYNPVKLSAWPRKTASCKNGVPVILASGRLSPQKDYPSLLRAFAKIVKARNAELIILGEGPEQSSIERLISELGIESQVKLLGNVDDPFQYYAQADLFILASKWEGFPNVLAEALASGLPVLTTDGMGASRDIVEPILPNNIVAVGDFEALASRALECLEESVDSNQLIDYAISRFDIENIADAYLSV